MGPTSLRVRAGLEEVIDGIDQACLEEVTDVDEAGLEEVADVDQACLEEVADVDEAGLEEVAEDIDNVLGAGLGARTHSQPVHLCLHIWFQSE